MLPAPTVWGVILTRNVPLESALGDCSQKYSCSHCVTVNPSPRKAIKSQEEITGDEIITLWTFRKASRKDGKSSVILFYFISPLILRLAALVGNFK